MKMIIFIFIKIILSCNCQYVHDEDTDILFPDWEIFYSPIEIPGCKYLGTINNCLCRECPEIRTHCYGDECTNFPVDITTIFPLFKLQLSSVAVIRKDDFRNLNNLTALQLEGNVHLRKIEEGVFRNMSSLKNLTITSNVNLKYLEEKVFEGLVNLEILCVTKNGFVRISDITRAGSPNYLPKLKVLSLAEHPFHEVHYDDFYPMNGSHLEQLNLVLSQLETIHPDCLKPLQKLTQLRLCQNLFNLTTLTNFIIRTLELGIQLHKLNLFQVGLRNTSPYKMLEALGKSVLLCLALTGNDFNTVDDQFFPYMPRFLSLDLRYCSIVEIMENAFLPLPKLQRLLLNGNKLISIPSAVTVPKGLYFLDLSTNSNRDQYSAIYCVPPNIFKNNLTNMTVLKLCYNSLGFLIKTMFSGLTSVVKLTMKNASLSYIEKGTFSDMRKLSYLELTNNPLLGKMPLTADIFLGLGNLQELLLGGCALNNLTSSPNIFTHVGNLTYLRLDGNNLRVILPNQLRHLNNLNNLQLYDNKLPSWNTRILPSSNLTVLNLSQNKLINITVAMLEDFITVIYLYLHDNPFWCDCTLFPASVWIQHNRMHVIATKYLDNYIAQCVAPDKWQGKSLVVFFNTMGSSNYTGECDQITVLTKWLSGSVLLVFLVAVMLIGYWYRWHIRYWLFLWRLSFAKHNAWSLHKKPTEHQVYEYDVFVSYSTEDCLWVQEMMRLLEPGLRLCVFERDFPVGDTISAAVLRAVLSSRRTLLLVSQAFVRSQWCRWEAQLAQHHQLFFRHDCAKRVDDTLLLVRLTSVRTHLTPTLRYLLKTRIYLDWPQDPDKQPEFWEKLRAALSVDKGENSKPL